MPPCLPKDFICNETGRRDRISSKLQSGETLPQQDHRQDHHEDILEDLGKTDDHGRDADEHDRGKVESKC